MFTHVYHFPAITRVCYGCRQCQWLSLLKAASSTEVTQPVLGLFPAHTPLLSAASDTALLQTALHWAQALGELETLHGTCSKPRGLWEGLAVLKQPGFGNFGFQEGDSLLTWTVDPGAFQAWLFDFSLFSSKTIFLLNGMVPPRGHFLVYLQPCYHEVKL